MKLLSNDAAQWILSQGAAMLLQSAVLVVVVALVDSAFRGKLRPATRHGLWLLVLVKLLLPPAIAFPTGLAVWIRSVRESSPGPTTAEPFAAFGGGDLSVVETSRAVASQAPHSGLVSPGSSMHWPQVVVGVWAVGSVGLALMVLVRNRRLGQVFQRSVTAGTELTTLLREAAVEVGVRRLPLLRLTDAMHSPAVRGCFRPAILIPAAMVRSLKEPVLRGILLHELSHIRRHDLWVQSLQVFVQVLWWWNPVAWIASSRLRVLRELAVDEDVQRLHGADRSHVYPGALVEVARLVTSGPQFEIGVIGVFESARSLRYRVTALLTNPGPRRTRLGPCGWAAIVALGLALIPMGVRSKVSAEDAKAVRGDARADRRPEPMETRTFKVSAPGDAENLSRVLQRRVDFANRTDLASAMREYLVSRGLEIFRRAGADGLNSSASRSRMARIEPAGDIVASLPESEMDALEQVLFELRGTPGQALGIVQIYELSPARGDLAELASGLDSRGLAVRTNAASAAILSRSSASTIRDRIVDAGIGRRITKRSFVASVATPADASSGFRAQALLDSLLWQFQPAMWRQLGVDRGELAQTLGQEVAVATGEVVVVLGHPTRRDGGDVRQALYLVEARR